MPISKAHSDRASGDQECTGIIGDRVPGWDIGEPAPSGAAKISLYISTLVQACIAELPLCSSNLCGFFPGEAEVRAVLPHPVQNYPDPSGECHCGALLPPSFGDIQCP